MARGGYRSNKPGDPARPNRTDMNTPAPSRFYGDSAQQKRQLDAVPIQPPPRPEVAGPPQMRVPPPFDRPSERPDEPVQAGLTSGPGPGPSPTAPPDLERLRKFLPILELAASTDGSSPALRQFVRVLRGGL